MYTIKKEFHFSSAHQLTGLPGTHPCSRLHGHNYILTLFLKSDKLDEVGFVKDYRELDFVKKYVDEVLDHQFLNEVFPLINTTVENMSREMFELFKPNLPQLIAIEMSETPKTTCIYSPE